MRKVGCGAAFLDRTSARIQKMSVEVLVAGVGAGFLLALLLMVLKDTSVIKDHDESES